VLSRALGDRLDPFDTTFDPFGAAVGNGGKSTGGGGSLGGGAAGAGGSDGGGAGCGTFDPFSTQGNADPFGIGPPPPPPAAAATTVCEWKRGDLVSVKVGEKRCRATVLDTQVEPGCIKVNIFEAGRRAYMFTVPLDTVGQPSLAGDSFESTTESTKSRTFSDIYSKSKSNGASAGASADASMSRQEELNAALVSECLCLSVDKVSQLIQKGADVNAVSSFGSTPLGNAARNGRLNIIKLLLDVPEINVTLPDEKKPHGIDSGATLLQAIVQRNNDDDAELIGRLIDLGLDVNYSIVSDQHPNGKGNTAMYRAAEKGLIRTVKLLLSKGARVNGANHANMGWSPLHIAASNCHVETVRVLIKAGADVTATTSAELAGVPAGSTPLQAVTVAKARHKPNSLASVTNRKDHDRFDETIAALKPARSGMGAGGGFGVKFKGAIGWRTKKK